MSEQDKKEVDQLSGVETTGHEWDGIKELNNPMPRWWLWVFYITIIWSIGYWVVYPAWPTISGNTKGLFQWTQFQKLEQEQAEIAARQAQYMERFRHSSFDTIMNDEELYAFANAGGASAFKNHCATCHGTGAAGSKGYPNLNDDDWIWGGTLDDIYTTLKYGIRSDHEETRLSQMPAFGKDGLMTRDEILEVTDFVLALSQADQVKPTKRGAELFIQNCASCHGNDAKGMREFGAPNLRDAIWLYGGDRETIYETIFSARAGVMPQWVTRLDDTTLRQLSVYVHQLGGGEE